MPKVSVLTPLYNTNPAHLRAMIESVLTQTFKDFEFILLNDSPSNHELEKIIKSYNDPRIRYMKNKTNIGISASRNLLIDVARGEYLAICDHDDISLPTRFMQEVVFLDNNPDIGVVSSNLIEMYNKKRITNYPQENLHIKADLMRRCCVKHPAAMVRKSVLVSSGVRYEAEFSPAEDYMLWIRLIEHTMFHNIHEPLLIYRNHPNNTSHMQWDKMKNNDAMIKNIAHAKYFYLRTIAHRPTWRINLFGIKWLPIISVQYTSKPDSCKRWIVLFGILPIMTIRC